MHSELYFCIPGNDSWIMKLTDRGVFFNRDQFAKASPDDFAQSVVDILESDYDVTIKRKDSYGQKSVCF